MLPEEIQVCLKEQFGRATIILMRKFVAILAICVIAAVPQLGVAQGNSDVQISPARVELKAEPGETVSFTLSTRTANDERVNFIKAFDFVQDSEETGKPLLLASTENEKYGIAKFITETHRNGHGASGTQQIEIEFNIPQNAAARTYYGTVSAGQQPPTTDAVGALVFIDVSSPTAAPAIESLEYDPSAGKFGAFKLLLANQGEGLFRDNFTLVYSFKGSSDQTLEPEKTGNVLPETRRQFIMPLKENLPPKHLRLQLKVNGQSTETSRMFELDRSTEVPQTIATAVEKSDYTLYFVGGGILAVLILTATALLIHKRRTRTT